MKVVFEPDWTNSKRCSDCGGFFAAAVDEDKFVSISMLASTSKSIGCPVCKNDLEIEYPANAVLFGWEQICPNCAAKLVGQVRDGQLAVNTGASCNSEFLKTLEHALATTSNGRIPWELARLLEVPACNIRRIKR